MQAPFCPQNTGFMDNGCYGDVPKVKDSIIVNAVPDKNYMGFNSRLCAG